MIIDLYNSKNTATLSNILKVLSSFLEQQDSVAKYTDDHLDSTWIALLSWDDSE